MYGSIQTSAAMMAETQINQIIQPHCMAISGSTEKASRPKDGDNRDNRHETAGSDEDSHGRIPRYGISRAQNLTKRVESMP